MFATKLEPGPAPRAAATVNGAYDGWLVCPLKKQRALARLFCLPYAGGGASIFSAWGRTLADDVEICGIQLPGRENRLREAPYMHIGDAVEAMAAALAPHLDRPFAIFGHSNGATLAIELARELRRNGWPQPLRLFVAGAAAPQIPHREPPIHHLPEAEFLEEIRKLDGTPSEILDNPQIMELLAPMLRADITMHETYTDRGEPPLACPISAFGGVDDQQVTLEDLDAWRFQTSAEFHLRLLPGGHFFLRTAAGQLLQFLNRDLDSSLAWRPGAASLF